MQCRKGGESNRGRSCLGEFGMRGEYTYERSCNHGWSRTDFIVFRTVPRSTGSCNTLVRTRDVGPSVVRNAE